MRSPVPPALPWLVWSTILAVGAFQLGTAGAGASADRGNRRRTPVVEAVEHVSPAVVSVDAFFGTPGRMVGRSSGAGVIVHPEGYVVTNSHVVQGVNRARIDRFGPGGEHDATLVADDPAGDLALLKIESRGPFPYVSLCAGCRLMLGETAIALGNPHGLGDTITVGVISALGRSAKMANGIGMRNLVQTDASINTGNSGGPLINLDGELIGINVSVLPSAKGIAFAIQADAVEALLKKALGSRTAPRRALPDEPGGEVADLRPLPTPPRREPASPSRTPSASPSPAPSRLPPPTVSTPLWPSDFGLEVRDDGRRLVVRDVPAGTPAAAAGLQRGDALLSVDGHPVEDESDLLLAFSATEPGRVYFLEVRRGPELKRILLVAP